MIDLNPDIIAECQEEAKKDINLTAKKQMEKLHNRVTQQQRQNWNNAHKEKWFAQTNACRNRRKLRKLNYIGFPEDSIDTPHD